MRKKLLAVTLSMSMVLGLMGCGSSQASTTTGADTTKETETKEAAAEENSAEETATDVTAAVSEIKIGLVNPLSGDCALYGMDQSRGISMAIEEINANGGVLGANLVLEEYDDQGDPQNAAKGAQKFADDDNIMAIAGSSLSNCTLAMAPIIDDAEVIEMVVSSSSPSLHGCSDYFFRMAVQDDQVGPQMAKVILDKGYTDIEVLYPNNDYGINLYTNLEAYVNDNNGKIVNAIDYNSADQDFTAILTTVKNDAPQAVALCGTVQDSSLLIDQMKKLGIDCYIMGGTSLYNTKALEIAGDAMEGVGCISVYISSNPDEKVQSFVTKYNEKYSETPDAFAAMAYDETYVFAAACEKAMLENDGEITRETVKDAMKETNYTGVTGTVTFDETNEWVRDYHALEVKEGEFVLAE